MERADSHGYAGQREAVGTPLPAQERSHARVLRTLADTTRAFQANLLARRLAWIKTT